MTTILVFAEEAEGQVTSTTLELLTKARSLGTAEAFIVTADASAAAATLGEYGATKVYALTDAGDQLPSAPGGAALAQVITDTTPDIVLFATSYNGRDVAARLSVRLDAPVISNVLDIAVADGVVAESAIFGGTKIVRTQFTADGTKIVLVRPKSFAAETAGGGAAEIVTVSTPDLGATGSTKLLESHVEASEGPKLEDADIVVSGGRGLGESENYQLVRDLAGTLGAATGASRAIVDAGWVPYSLQVGQTGKTVKPNIYIAAGISGAMQHMVGMKGSKHIIAINKDPEAPIHQIADIGIVGDVKKVLPQLIDAIKAKKG